MKSRFLFVLFFVALGFIALQIPISIIKGSRVPFTLFDLFAPIAGAFLGVPLAILSVIGMQATNLGFHGFSGVNAASPLTLIATLRFLPMIVGVWFFAKKEGKLLVIPALSIIVFNLHPVGRTVWFYSLFWTIPFILWPIRERFLLARSLSATFAVHSVGGAIWIWAFPTTSLFWIGLIPVVALERSIFALGISAFYILTTNVLAYLSKIKLIPKIVDIDQRYLIKF